MTWSPVVPAALALSLLSGCTLVRGVPSGPAPSAEATIERPDPEQAEAGTSQASESDGPDRDVERTYRIGEESYDVWSDADGYLEQGLASWYGEELAGRPTASGEPFDPYAMTAAHRSLPLGTRVEVENLDNGRSVIVRVNDRGPFVDERIIDLSLAAAQALGFAAQGTASVRVRAID